MVRSHEANVRNWVFGLPGMGTAAPFAESGMRRLVRDGDTLFSYGQHFPLVRLIRTRSGKPSHWLISGDTWSGGWSMTSAHQSAVRSVIESVCESLGMKRVIVPQSVLDAAGINTATLQIVDVSEDWWEDRVEEFEAEPEGSFWAYGTTRIPGTGVRVHRSTGEVFEPGWNGNHHIYEPPGRPKYSEYIDYTATREVRSEQHDAFARAEQKWEHDWEKYPAVEHRTGHRYLVLNKRTMQPLEQYERADGTIGSRYAWRRHWLGESLIRGQVSYASTAKCWRCGGTGQDEWTEPIHGCEGPLNEPDSARMDEHEERRRRTWSDPDYLAARTVSGVAVHPQCRTCGGSKRIRATKQRWAYFLSGFDHNEPRPSYFFSELPPGAKPRTLAEAYLALKPRTVQLAEELGRTVLRQGDQWFVEMPGLTLRELKRQGGTHFKRGGEGRELQLGQPSVITGRWQIPRFQRFVNMDCWLHGTTHEASEVVRVGALYYARGIVRHVPERRTPDHIPLPLGDRKTWFLCVPNGTPTGA